MKEFVEKLIARLGERKSKVNGLSDIVWNNAVKMCIDEVNELAEEHKGGWISVNDRLPTKEGSYLVVGKTGGATVTRWYEPSKFYPNGHFGGNSAEYIRYWMPRPQAPLPEPYKGV